jgi:hypothetical protein
MDDAKAAIIAACLETVEGRALLGAAIQSAHTYKDHADYVRGIQEFYPANLAYLLEKYPEMPRADDIFKEEA